MASLIRERVGDLQVEKTSGNETNGVTLDTDDSEIKITLTRSHLPDPALLNVILEGEPPDHGSEGVGVSQLRHCLDLKLL